MVTTFAEYLLAEREGFFEMRPVSHNLISLRCSLSLPPWIRKGMKEISFGSLHFGRRGSMKLVWQELCAGTVSGLLFTERWEGGSGRLLRDGVGKAEGAGGTHLPQKL